MRTAHTQGHRHSRIHQWLVAVYTLLRALLPTALISGFVTTPAGITNLDTPAGLVIVSPPSVDRPRSTAAAGTPGAATGSVGSRNDPTLRSLGGALVMCVTDDAGGAASRQPPAADPPRNDDIVVLAAGAATAAPGKAAEAAAPVAYGTAAPPATGGTRDGDSLRAPPRSEARSRCALRRPDRPRLRSSRSLPDPSPSSCTGRTCETPAHARARASMAWGLLPAPRRRVIRCNARHACAIPTVSTRGVDGGGRPGPAGSPRSGRPAEQRDPARARSAHELSSAPHAPTTQGCSRASDSDGESVAHGASFAGAVLSRCADAAVTGCSEICQQRRALH